MYLNSGLYAGVQCELAADVKSLKYLSVSAANEVLIKCFRS